MATRTRSVRRRSAKEHAEKRGPAFFSGEEALREVAKDDGSWNWVLVGPDPEHLPLSAGGAGSIEEMCSAIGKHSHSFGLVRMAFGTGSEAMTKFLFIHATDDVESRSLSLKERGHDMSMEPKMEEAISCFASCAAKVHIQSKEDCSLERLVETLRSVVSGEDAQQITIDSFNRAEHFRKEQHPELQMEEEKQRRQSRYRTHLVAPRSFTMPGEIDTELSEQVEEVRRQRKKVKRYGRGDVVEVFSAKRQKWFQDGQVAEAVNETCHLDGVRVNAGSIKVIYDHGTRFKWIPPQQFEDSLRESPRPRPPDVMVGELLLQESTWLVARWVRLRFELNQGFLQWWSDESDASTGEAPLGSVYLLGLQQKHKGLSFNLRTGTQQHAFLADTEELAEEWEEALWVHAGYCEDVHRFYEAKLGSRGSGAGSVVALSSELQERIERRELTTVMERRSAKEKLATVRTSSSSARSSPPPRVKQVEPQNSRSSRSTRSSRRPGDDSPNPSKGGA